MHASMSIGIFLGQIILRQSCSWEYICIASDILRRHIITASSTLQSFHPPFHNDLWVLGAGVFCSCSVGTDINKSAYWFVVVFNNDLSLLQRCFHDEGWQGLHLSAGIRIDNWGVVRDNAALGKHCCQSSSRIHGFIRPGELARFLYQEWFPPSECITTKVYLPLLHLQSYCVMRLLLRPQSNLC